MFVLIPIDKFGHFKLSERQRGRIGGRDGARMTSTEVDPDNLGKVSGRTVPDWTNGDEGLEIPGKNRTAFSRLHPTSTVGNFFSVNLEIKLVML